MSLLSRPKASAFATALTLLAGAARLQSQAPSPAPHAATLSAAPVLRVVDPAYIDRATNACVDFFQFANGAWLTHDTIPAIYSSSGVARDMTDGNELVVRSVLDEAVAQRSSAPAGSTPRKLGTFYAACMDSAAAERAGLAPIQSDLQRIDAIRARGDVLPAIAALQRTGTTALFEYTPQPDPHDAARYMVWLTQGGLGLPDRDYYTDRGPSADSTRTRYVEHVARLLALAGAPSDSARRDAGRVMRLETALAKASLTQVALRQPSAVDHPTSVARLRSLAPGLDWPSYARLAGLTVPVGRVNLAEPAFFQRADSLLRAAPLADWRAYLRYHLLARSARWLSTPFVQEDFAFSQQFTGAKALLPRWKRCARETDNDMGEALGQAYIAKTFSPEAKARARAVIDDIRSAFRTRLVQLAWMSDSTRQFALEKLERMHEKVGYPDTWRDYSRLAIPDSGGPFIRHVMAAAVFEWDRVVNRPGSPVDTSEWGMTVPTVNAYYDAGKNEMVFPAGALAPQTFDPRADDGANYGSLGASWAGHELTHGFDDQGRHFDASGNLRDWWTPRDSAAFEQQAQRVVHQYDGYIQVDTFHVNGALTEGENIADYGGVLTAYDALQRALERDGRPGLIDGFTPEQRFFLGFAQSFRAHARPEDERTRVTVDPHSPERWRVNGPLSNSAAFAAAFDCKPGDPMVRPRSDAPQIW